MNETTVTSYISTGIAGLDDVLHGGLPVGHTYLIEGDPGTGKTTLAMQFLLEAKRAGRRCLYITLSESKDEIESAAHSHGWSLDEIPIVEFVPEETALHAQNHYTVFHPNEVELADTINRMLAEIERINPECLVIDSLSEFRLLAPDAVRHRRQILALKQYFGGRKTTTLLLDICSDATDKAQLESVAHGVIRLMKMPRSYGIGRRRLEVLKLRGAGFREGSHDYTILKSGVTVFPRLIAAEHEGDWPEERVLSGVAALDVMFGGGFELGSSTLLIGPTGVGKSSIVMQYALESSIGGRRSVLYSFDEGTKATKARARSLGMNLDAALRGKNLLIKQINPAEASPGEFVLDIRREVEQNNARVIVLDSLNGFLHAMPGESDLLLQLHELLIFLMDQGVATFLVLAQHGLVDDMRSVVDASYLADNVVVMRYFEANASVRRAISVLKKRGGPHENTIRELKLSSAGIHVGEPLIHFRGVLSGLPDYREQDLSTDGQKNGSGQ